MNIAIIGAGNVGSTLGQRWAAIGHEICFGVRTPDDSKYTFLRQSAEVTTVESAAQNAEVVVLATPWKQAKNAIESMGESLNHKVLIDCTNPLKPDLSGLTVGHTSSGAEQIAEWAPQAKVVKAFNSCGFNVMANPVMQQQKTVMFIAGDNTAARKTVAQLVNELDFEAIETGDLSMARLLEPFALLWISLAYRFGLGRDFGFALVRR